MIFSYSKTHPAQDETDALPRLPFVLRRGEHEVNVFGLVDSGSLVNVLPYDIGLQLGGIWDERTANIRLAGSLGNMAVMPVFAAAEIDGLPSVTLAFAWVKSDNVPLILGQTNFFMEFDVCFYRAQLKFDVRRRTELL